MELIWGKCEAESFCRAIWTTQIALNRLVKFDFSRSGVRGALDERRAIDACGFARRATGYAGWVSRRRNPLCRSSRKAGYPPCALR